MADVIKDDGSIAELSEESLAILGAEGAGDVTEDVGSGGGDKEVADDPAVLETSSASDTEVTDTTEPEHDAVTGDEEVEPESPERLDDGGDKEVAKWYTDADVELAKSYNISVEQLDGFEDASDFRKHAIFFDKGVRPAQQQEQTKEPEATAEETPPAEDDIDLAWYEKEGYGEGELKLVKATKAAMDRAAKAEQALAEIREWQANERERAELARHEAMVESFHVAVNGLGDDMFGDSSKDPESLRTDTPVGARRFKVYETLMQYGDAFGDAPMHVKVQRAVNIAFGDEILAREKKAMHEKLAAQSRKRRPVASTNRMRTQVKSPQKPPENPNDVNYILDDPEVQARFERYDRENGVG